MAKSTRRRSVARLVADEHEMGRRPLNDAQLEFFAAIQETPAIDYTTIENQTEVFLNRWVFKFQREEARRDLAELIAMVKGESWPGRPSVEYDAKQLGAVDVTWLCCGRTVQSTNVAMGCHHCNNPYAPR